MKEVVNTTYMAFDGKIFLNKEDCTTYEKENALVNSLQKVSLYTGDIWSDDELSPIPTEVLIKYYTTNGDGALYYCINEVSMVKIASDTTDEELQFLKAFFELVANENQVYIENISAGMAIIWDADYEEWVNMYRYLEQFEEKISRLKELAKF